MSYRSTSTKINGQVLNYNPMTNAICLMDYTERSVHTKHKKMYKVTTTNGYSIVCTDDHSLATNGQSSFFRPLKPHKAKGKFIPIVFMVDIPPDEGEYESCITMPLKRLKEKIDGLFKEYQPGSYLGYTANSEEQKQDVLIGLARLGYGPVVIKGLDLQIKKPFLRLLPEEGKLVPEDIVAGANPANPYLHLPFTWDMVESVEEVPREDTTYDFSVPKFPLFIANGILVYDTIN